MTSDDRDRALLRAWELYDEGDADEVEAEIEALLPDLFEAGYVRVSDDRWSFTPAGVARAKELEARRGLVDSPKPET